MKISINPIKISFFLFSHEVDVYKTFSVCSFYIQNEMRASRAIKNRARKIESRNANLQEEDLSHEILYRSTSAINRAINRADG